MPPVPRPGGYTRSWPRHHPVGSSSAHNHSDKEQVMNLDNRPAKPELAAHLIEEGAASMQLAGPASRKPAPKREYFAVVVIGGGQAGLPVGDPPPAAG